MFAVFLALLAQQPTKPLELGDTTSPFALIVSDDAKKHELVLKKLDCEIGEQRALLTRVVSFLRIRRLEPMPDMAKEHGKHSSIATALRVLGRFPDEESVPILIEYVEFEDAEEKLGGYKPPDNSYPALRALKRIGKPAVEAAIQRLKSQDNSRQAEANCVWLLVDYYGPAMAKTRLRRELEREFSDQAARFRLSAAMRVIRTDERDLNSKD